MSAPRTNVQKQKRHHIGPIIGIILVALFGVGLILFWIFEMVEDAPAPAEQGAEQQESSPTEPEQAQPEVLNPTLDN